MIVTGGASGIGTETTAALAAAGASVVIAARRPDAAEVVARDLRARTANPNIQVRPLDLSDLRSVTRFLDGWDGPLHTLVNNAGIMAVKALLSNNGFAARTGFDTSASISGADIWRRKSPAVVRHLVGGNLLPRNATGRDLQDFRDRWVASEIQNLFHLCDCPRPPNLGAFLIQYGVTTISTETATCSASFLIPSTSTSRSSSSIAPSLMLETLRNDFAPLSSTTMSVLRNAFLLVARKAA
ncbi:SDR family NAD(P)-dependent oxidoreductase [Rhizobium mongolense]|nr:SDR family NAD(P)-dependent oxidoreductase [Rhizobium mongolense]MBB4228879.1 hypothetical protein [Rhizobium mongolense]